MVSCAAPLHGAIGTYSWQSHCHFTMAMWYGDMEMQGRTHAFGQIEVRWERWNLPLSSRWKCAEWFHAIVKCTDRRRRGWVCLAAPRIIYSVGRRTKHTDVLKTQTAEVKYRNVSYNNRIHLIRCMGRDWHTWLPLRRLADAIFPNFVNQISGFCSDTSPGRHTPTHAFMNERMNGKCWHNLSGGKILNNHIWLAKVEFWIWIFQHVCAAVCTLMVGHGPRLDESPNNILISHV